MTIYLHSSTIRHLNAFNWRRHPYSVEPSSCVPAQKTDTGTKFYKVLRDFEVVERQKRVASFTWFEFEGSRKYKLGRWAKPWLCNEKDQISRYSNTISEFLSDSHWVNESKTNLVGPLELKAKRLRNWGIFVFLAQRADIRLQKNTTLVNNPVKRILNRRTKTVTRHGPYSSLILNPRRTCEKACCPATRMDYTKYRSTDIHRDTDNPLQTRGLGLKTDFANILYDIAHSNSRGKSNTMYFRPKSVFIQS